MLWPGKIFGFTRKSEDLIKKLESLNLILKVKFGYINPGFAQIESTIEKPT